MVRLSCAICESREGKEREGKERLSVYDGAQLHAEQCGGGGDVV